MTRSSGDSSNKQQAEAKKLYREFPSVYLNFQVSSGRVRHFMTCHHLSVCKRISIAQKLPADYKEYVIDFQRYVIKIWKNHSYDLAHIGNAD